MFNGFYFKIQAGLALSISYKSTMNMNQFDLLKKKPNEFLFTFERLVNDGRR